MKTILVVIVSVAITVAFLVLLFLGVKFLNKRKNKPEIINTKANKKLDTHAEIINKKDIPFTLPFPEDRLVCVLYRPDIKTYCIFAMAYPELHITLKFVQEQTPSQKEIHLLALNFTSLFMNKLKPRIFLNVKQQDKRVH